MQNCEYKKLGDVCEIRPARLDTIKNLTDNDEVSFLPMEDLQIMNYYINAKQTKLLKEVSGSYTCFANGDVLLAKVTPCFENGKQGIAKDLENGVGFGSSEYIVFRPSEQVTSEYIYYALATPDFKEGGKKNLLGACGLKRLSKEYVTAYEIPLPPLEEQKRIVKILDEKFAQLETVKANAKANLQNAKDLFQSQLTKAFSNNSWEKKRIDEISENHDSERIPITKNVRESGEYPYYGASGIVDYVADYIFEGKYLLVSEDGANLLARTYPIAFVAEGKFWVNNHAHILKFDNDITMKFVELYFSQLDLSEFVTGMAQPKFNQASLNKLEIPLPPLPEQKRIVEQLDSLSQKVRFLEALYKKQLANCDELKQAFLAKAFAGEL